MHCQRNYQKNLTIYLIYLILTIQELSLSFYIRLKFLLNKGVFYRSDPDT